MHLPEYSCQCSYERKSGNQLHIKGKYHVRRVAGPSSGSTQLANYVTHLFIYMLLNCQCCSSPGVVVLTRTLEKTLLGLAWV